MAKSGPHPERKSCCCYYNHSHCLQQERNTIVAGDNRVSDDSNSFIIILLLSSSLLILAPPPRLRRILACPPRPLRILSSPPPSKMGPWQCALPALKTSIPEIAFFRFPPGAQKNDPPNPISYIIIYQLGRIRVRLIREPPQDAVPPASHIIFGSYDRRSFHRWCSFGFSFLTPQGRRAGPQAAAPARPDRD